MPVWLFALMAVACGVPAHGPVDVGPAPAAGSQESTAPPGDSTTIAVTVYFTEKGAGRPVTRQVPRTPRIGTETLEALLVGPTANESARGVTTAIPTGTSLLGLVIDQGLAKVNLSSPFGGAAGTGSLAIRAAQVACTLAGFPSIRGLLFSLDGRPFSIPVGDGTLTDRPVTCANYPRYLRHS
jgi:spore germination protein GerM